jgi:predicted ribosome-associated RNA-binding protein Tma20
MVFIPSWVAHTWKVYQNGVANRSSGDIEMSKKGKVIKNLHYVGDKLWGAVS